MTRHSINHWIINCTPKVERSNKFLHNIVTTARRGESVYSRTVGFILNEPIHDGGQWDMLVNLVNKYGLMPKKCFPESFSCENSIAMNRHSYLLNKVPS